LSSRLHSFSLAERQTSFWLFLKPISTVMRCDGVKHFTDEAWIDFVRQVMPPDEAAVIQEHLNDACEECRNSCAIWRTAAEIASRESRYEVPQQTVRMLEATYAEWRGIHVLPKSARVARLVFDSFLEPLPFGVRASSASARRILCRSGEWTIDMRLEREGGNRMFLAGQVLRSAKKTGAHVASMDITLMSADRLLTQASTNQFGEFQMKFDCAQDLQLYIDIPGRRPIAVPIPGPDVSSQESASEQGER